MIFFAFLQKVRLKSSLIVPIVGMMFGAVVSAISTFIAIVSTCCRPLAHGSPDGLPVSRVGRYEPLWIVLIVCALVVVLADRFTCSGLGKRSQPT